MVNPGGTNSPATRGIAIGDQGNLARCSGSVDQGSYPRAIGTMIGPTVVAARVADREVKFYRPVHA